jgi:excisionase family DNA binding protein
MTPIQPYLTPQQAADYLAVSPRTLEAWRINGGGPTYHRLTPRAVRYRREELDSWLAARAFRHTSEEPAKVAA